MSSTAPADLPSYGGSLALTFVSLAFVCLLAWVVLRLIARKGVGRGEGGLRVVARCPLEPRRSVYVVEAGSRCFLIGVGDGSMSLIAELDGATLSSPSQGSAESRQSTKFSEVLSRAMGRS
jgi:flagellar biosynthetic protein FliO